MSAKATTAVTDLALENGANKASDQLIKFMDNNNKVSPSGSAYSTRLKSALGSGFQKIENKNLDIKVYETTEANVVTLNNGSIRIYSSMMDILSDDELCALISMQAGHIKTGNVRNNLLKAVAGDDLDNMTENQINKLFSFSADKIKNIMNEILQMSYTQKQNKSADSYGKKSLVGTQIKTTSFESLCRSWFP